MSSKILQQADDALREAMDIIHEKGSQGSGDLSQDQVHELLNEQEDLRDQHEKLRKPSKSTVWPSWSSSTPATEHLKQCKELIHRIWGTIEGNKRANIRNGRAPSAATVRSSSSTLPPFTPEGDLEIRTTTNSQHPNADVSEDEDDDEDETTSTYATGVTHAIDTPLETSASTTSQPPVLPVTSNEPAPTPTAAQQSRAPQPTTSKRAKAGGFTFYHNSVNLDDAESAVGTTLNVGGYQNTGSAVHGH